MRSSALALVGLLSACAAAQPPIHGETLGHSCQAGATQGFVGQIRNEAVGSAILEASHAAVIRWAPPGVMLTMDFRDDRVTVYLDPDQKITRITCG